MAGWVVEVSGLRQILNALNEVDKKAAKAITDEIGKAAKGVAAQASYFTPHENPLSNWGSFTTGGRDVSYSGSAASAGFKMRRSNFRKRGVSAGASWDVLQTNAGGSMFEVIGSGARVKTPQGRNLVDVVNSRFPGQQPRSLVKAYYAVIDADFSDRIARMIQDEARKAGLV